jgi:hypothetical protein
MQNVKKVLLWLVAIFAVLTVLRLIYVYVTDCDVNQYYSYASSSTALVDSTMAGEGDTGGKAGGVFESTYFSRNFAIQKEEAAPQSAPVQAGGQIEQIYEKIATMENSTKNYDTDEAKLKDTIKQQQAVTQKEQITGLKGNRVLYMTIGISPDKFDTFVDLLKAIGKMRQFDISKADRTGDYKVLMAKKAALQETKRSLMELKKHNGKIEELIELETKIYETGKEMQALDLDIGAFEGGKNYCTVRFTLKEEIVRKPAFMGRLLSSSGWSLIKMLQAAAIVFFSLLIIWICGRLMLMALNFTKLAGAKLPAKKRK